MAVVGFPRRVDALERRIALASICALQWPLALSTITRLLPGCITTIDRVATLAKSIGDIQTSTRAHPTEPIPDEAIAGMASAFDIATSMKSMFGSSTVEPLRFDEPDAASRIDVGRARPSEAPGLPLPNDLFSFGPRNKAGFAGESPDGVSLPIPLAAGSSSFGDDGERGFGLVLLRSLRDTWVLKISIEPGQFERDAFAAGLLMRRVAGDLQRAFLVSHRLGTPEQPDRRVIEACWDKLDFGAVLVGPDLRVCASNAVADDLMETRSLFRPRGRLGRIVAANARAQVKFSEALERVIFGVSSQERLSLEGLRNVPPLAVMLLRTGRQRSGPGHQQATKQGTVAAHDLPLKACVVTFAGPAQAFETGSLEQAFA